MSVILTYSTTYKEGFFNFPVEHNKFIDESKIRFNDITNLVNLTDPAVSVSENTSDAFKKALGYDYVLPITVPNTFQQAKQCEKYSATCDAFDDPTFASNCGISFDIKGLNSSGKPHIGGLYISPDDRKTQMDMANNVISTGSAPYNPYKVYKPTLGTSTAGNFAITKDQCKVIKETIECATKQTFGSPNCTQCYTSQSFSRVGPETQRIPSTLFLYGNGLVSVSSTTNISLSKTTLNETNPIQVNIPGDAEGTVFIIQIEAVSTLTYVSGYIQGQTARGTFKLDIINMIQSDLVTNSKPRINGSINVNGFRCMSIVPGNGKNMMSLSCLVPFSFLSMYDGDVLTCDNGPVITQAASATFLESDPCFGKKNSPGNYTISCLQERWTGLGGSTQGTGYPINLEKANAIQIDSSGNPLNIDTIVNNLAPAMRTAATGIMNGKSLNLSDWNSISMWATGVPINTPCDGIAKDNGPLSQECLSYLYLNQGVNSHIGPTYTLPASEVASMKNQTTDNTYCQLGTSIDPSTTSGLEFGGKLGGVNAVKKTYDQINRVANDNTLKNADRSQALEQCYGISLDTVM